MNAGTSFLAGGAIGGLFGALLGQVKALFAWLRNLVLIRVELEDQLGVALVGHLVRTCRATRGTTRCYSAYWPHVRPRGRRQMVAYEARGRTTQVFWRGIVPLHVSYNGEKGKGLGALVLLVPRGFMRIEPLLIAAVEDYNRHKDSGSTDRRYTVSRLYGSIGDGNGQERAASFGPPQPETPAADGAWFWDKHLVGWAAGDVGEALSVDADPLARLAFPSEVWAAVAELRRWLAAADWHRSRGIPWHRGWLIKGAPGTGKTSLVRGIGQALDLPIIVLHLPSHSSRDLQRNWDWLKNRTPCIALIEDIDATFEHRKNVTRGGELGSPVSFDTLLNVIDGVENSDGVVTIITTNRPDLLDPALGGNGATRPGRIDRIIALGPLGAEERMQVAQRILADCPERIKEHVGRGEGMTGAQFQELCTQVALDHFWGEKERARA